MQKILLIILSAVVFSIAAEESKGARRDAVVVHFIVAPKKRCV